MRVATLLKMPSRTDKAIPEGGLLAPERIAEEQNFRQVLGLRGLFALFVFVYHALAYQLGPADVSIEQRVLSGHQTMLWLRNATAVFFILSGYHLYRRFVAGALRGKLVDTRSYLLRRAARILPLYYITLLASLILFRGGARTDGIRWPADHLWSHFVLAQNYFPETWQSLNVVTWTLGIDVVFYLTLPLLGLLGVYIFRGLAGQIVLLAGLFGFGMWWRFTHVNALLVPHFLLPQWLPYFVGGMSVALWVEWRRYKTGSAPRLGFWTTMLIGYGGAAMILTDGLFISPSIVNPWGGMLVITGTPLVLAACSSGHPRPTFWLATRVMTMIGALSYGIFLWSLPVVLSLRRIDHLVSLPNGGIATIALAFPLTLAAAALTFRFVELPISRRVTEATGGGE